MEDRVCECFSSGVRPVAKSILSNGLHTLAFANSNVYRLHKLAAETGQKTQEAHVHLRHIPDPRYSGQYNCMHG